jgi:hypothetical protein
MPYIKESAKWDLLHNTRSPETAGELNYAITKLAVEYLNTHGEKYQTYNDIVGAMECAKQELYRRKITDYEIRKSIDNGDVYT